MTVSFDDDLLVAAARLLARRSGQRGPLPSARIRRSISTSYYALFHFLSDEVTLKVVGSNHDLRRRRRILARSLTHRGLRTALDKVRGRNVDAIAADFLRPLTLASDPVPVPTFVRELAAVFSDAQAKRHDADYDLNKTLGETDARLLRQRVRRTIASWRAATSPADRDFKHALCLLLLLKGQLRSET